MRSGERSCVRSAGEDVLNQLVKAVLNQLAMLWGIRWTECVGSISNAVLDH